MPTQMIEILLLILLGILAGALSGMGIGGGTILIPALTMLFGQTQHAAQNINLVYFIPTAAFAVIIHAKNKKIEKKFLPKIIIVGMVAALIGSLIALNLEAGTLRKIFAIFLLMMGIAEFLKKPLKESS
jgi:hypothetical protein